MAKAKYLSLLALSALLVSCGPSTSDPTTSVEEPSSEPTTSEVPTTAPTSDPTSDPTVPPFVGPSSVGLIGSMTESNWETDIPLTGDSEGKIWTLSDYPFSAGDEWKLRADGAWDWQWSFDNLDEASAALFENAGGYGNVKVLTSAYYSISVNAETDVVSVVKGEDIVPDEPDTPDVPEGPSWPGEEFQALVYTATGSEVVVPAFEGASSYELVPDYASYFGLAVIFCYTDDAEAESKYYDVLVDAGWYAEKTEDGIAAIDPSEEIMLEASYDPEYSSFDIYVGAYNPLPTEWPAEEFQALVYEATGSEVVVPAYEGASAYELVPDYASLMGIAVIFCYTDDVEAESKYYDVLVDAGWYAEKTEDGVVAIDPSEEVMLQGLYDPEYGSFDIYVGVYSPLPTEWPTEDVQALVYEATGSEVVVPAYEDGYAYELNDSGLEYGEAYIYCYTEDVEAATAYEEVLVAAGWELFVDEEWYGTCAIDPSGELVVSYEYAEDYGSLDLCVFAYEEPGEGGEEGEVTPESILYDYLDSIGLTGGSVTVAGDEAYFAYKITNFDSIQELCEVATYNAPTYLTLAVEPTQDELTTGGECWYSVLTTEDNTIAVEVLTYWATETEPVLQVLAYYL